jgi:hypothetical protein
LSRRYSPECLPVLLEIYRERSTLRNEKILDAARHQREKEINILARMVVEKDFSMERVMEEIDQLWPGKGPARTGALPELW